MVSFSQQKPGSFSQPSPSQRQCLVLGTAGFSSDPADVAPAGARHPSLLVSIAPHVCPNPPPPLPPRGP